MSLYMCIDTMDADYVSPITEIDGVEGSCWVEIGTYDLGIFRQADMTVGSGNAGVTSKPAFSEAHITKALDGASPYLSSYVLSHGKDDRTITIADTVNLDDGAGLAATFIIILEKCRLTAYNISSGAESITIAYANLTMGHRGFDESGELAASPTEVSYDLRNATMDSNPDG